MQRRWVAGVLASVALAGCRSPALPPSSPSGSAAWPSTGSASSVPPASRGGLGFVTRVSDGDTIVVDGDRVRLIGIDAPESVAPGQRVECFGREAAARLRGLLPDGTAVRLESDPANGGERDRYGRRLAYVHRETDGLFVNLVLVQGGFALAYPYGQTRQYREELAAAEAEAKAARRGLWGICRVQGR